MFFSFRQEHLFLIFFRRLYVFTEQIFQEDVSLTKQKIHIFQEDMVGLFAEQIPFFQSLFMCSPNIPILGRSTFLATTKQIPIFQKHLILSSTEQITIFQEAFFEYQRTDRQFPGRYLLRTDI